MALLERVTTLVRANLNDLIDRAENPEKMIKQVILDMQNQLMQVKTQVAIAIADEHVLRRKQAETEDLAADWTRKAELSLDSGQEDLARTALARVISSRDVAEGFARQVEDQAQQVRNLKEALLRLDQKLQEARAKADVLMAQHRRARSLRQTGEARLAVNDSAAGPTFDRMKDKIQYNEAVGEALAELLHETPEDKFAILTRQDRVEKLLREIQAKRLPGGER